MSTVSPTRGRGQDEPHGATALVPWAPLLFHVAMAVATVALEVGDILPSLFSGDLNRYRHVATGPTFWREQPVEFPPLGAAMLWATARWAGASAWILFSTNAALDALTAVAIQRTWGSHATGSYLLLSGILVPLSYFRLDHLAVLLVVLGLAAREHGRPARWGMFLGLGTLAKLWPGVLLSAIPARRWQAWAGGAAVIAVGMLLWGGLFGTDAFEQVLTARGAVGWHIESVPGSIVHALAGDDVRMEGGAWRTGDPPTVALLLLAPLGIAAVVRLHRLERQEDRDLGIVTCTLALAPLFSLQYMLWLTPLVAIIPPGWVRRRTSRLVLAASLLTIGLGVGYTALLAGRPWAVLVLGARNAAVVMIGVTVLLPRPRRRDAASSKLGG